MLQVTRRLRCTFQKDRIHALSGFATADTSPNKSPEPKERTQSVYRKCAQQVLEKMHTLDLLSAVQYESVIRTLSWVPRWNICTTHTLAPLGSNLNMYNASCTSPLCQFSGQGIGDNFCMLKVSSLIVLLREDKRSLSLRTQTNCKQRW